MKDRKKLIPTLQIAQTECGLCCVETILKYFGRDVTMAEMRQIAEPGRDGLSSDKIKSVLRHYGMDTETYKVKSLKAFNMIELPVIAFWKEYHYICIESVDDKKVVIMDPSVGRMTIEREEFQRSFSNIIISARPNEKFEKKKEGILGRLNLKTILPKNIKSMYIALAVISLMMMAINVALPFFTQILIDKGSGNPGLYKYLILSIAGLVTVTALTMYARAVISVKLTKKFSRHLISSAFKRVLDLPAKYFSVRAPGEIVYRLNSLTRIQDLFGVSIVQFFLDCLSMIAIMIYVLHISAILFLFEVFFVAALFFTLIKFQPKIMAATDKEIHEGSDAQSTQLDAIVSINSVKLGGYKDQYLEDWSKKYNKALDATGQRIHIQQAVINTILVVLQNFAPLVIFFAALFFKEKGILTFGQAVAIQSISSLLFVYVNSVFSAISEFSLVTRYIDIADDVLRYPAEVSGDKEAETPVGEITVENVSYSYDNNSIYAVKNLNLKVKAGETIAFVGRSGSGKTTIGKMLCSLFTPTEGRILFDGVDFKEYDLEKLRSQIGYIPQEAYLHNRSILENLKLGTTLSDEEIIRQCEEYDFMDFVKTLPMGYNTFISELGGNLSGGQRQRIFIAKILLQKPKVLVMDEATSSLDNISQKSIYNELNNLGCTKFIIAHRLETILNADRIILIEDGVMKESGTHKELIHNNRGAYYKLFNTEYSIEEKYGKSS
ncbi:peptidase domain-containing ABC transporter [Eubacterium ruminantium]|uniref:peptidase domain-containing ABC transporter n=1 Tax=Eubacterium ruminantium TaxID=42322 RepID=UPI0015684D4E|nr:peptidase domain-containing ABC transporter [Eubacterium ruminantium]